MPYQGETAAIVSGISIAIVLTLLVIGLRAEKAHLAKNRDDHH